MNFETQCLGQILKRYDLWHAASVDVKHLRENKDVGKAISYEDETLLLNACGESISPSLLTIFIVSIDTGLRMSEVKALRRRDVAIAWNGSTASGELVVPESKTEAGKKRVVPLTGRACAVLTTWLSRFGEGHLDDYVFPRHSVRMLKGSTDAVMSGVDVRKPVRSWQHAWRRVLRETRLRYRWHDLRHTFVTRLAENPNVSEQTILALAGHVSKQMLERYSHIRTAKKRDAIADIERSRLRHLAGGTEVGTAAQQNCAKQLQVV